MGWAGIVVMYVKKKKKVHLDLTPRFSDQNII